MRFRFASSPILALALLLLPLLAGCGGGGDDRNEGRVFVFHAVRNASNLPVDVVINDTRAASALNYASLQRNTDIDSGSGAVSVFTAGTGQTLIANQGIDITDAVDQVLLIGGESGGTGNNAPRVVNLGRVDIANSSIPISSQARVYFVNAVPDAPANGASFGFQQGGGSQNVTGAQSVDYAEITNEQLLDSGDYSFQATVGGQTVTAPVTNLGNRGVYLVTLTGYPQSTGQQPGLGIQVNRLD